MKRLVSYLDRPTFALSA